MPVRVHSPAMPACILPQPQNPGGAAMYLAARSVGRTDGRTDGQTDEWMDKQTVRQTDIWSDGQTNGWSDGQRTQGWKASGTDGRSVRRTVDQSGGK